MDLILLETVAFDIVSAKRLVVYPISGDEVDRVVPAPLPPALLYRLPRLEVERNAEAERRLRIRIVGRRHAQVHDAVDLREGKFFLLPHVRKEPLDAPVVLAFGQALALRLAQRVVGAGFATRQAGLRELG